MVAGVGLFHLVESNGVAESSSAEPTALVSIPLIDTEGKKHLLGDWSQPVLVVNFWAPWCVPCRREVPALIEIQNQFDEQVQVLGLALDSVENVESFATEHGMNYPSFIAGNQIPMYNAAFGNQSGALPFTAFIDRERRVNYYHHGELSLEQLQQNILELL